MVLSGNDIQDRFEYLLKTHTNVYIATGWATGGRHLRALTDVARRTRNRVKVRAIVGISGNVTRPDALEELRNVTGGDLRIVRNEGHLFHPKLYLFKQRGNGNVKCRAWIGSANFTNRGFGGHRSPNEEIMLEVAPGVRANALAGWFKDCWKRHEMDCPVEEVIRQYRELYLQNPPSRSLQRLVYGPVDHPDHRKDLLDDAHRPLTLMGYQEALEKCEWLLRGEGWKILNAQGRSYMRVISRRRELLLGESRWSDLEGESRLQLKGGTRGTDSHWWGLMGRMGRSNWPAVLRNEDQIRSCLGMVVNAPDTEFPGVAIGALQKMREIDYVGIGTATLLLTLARPDRLLSVNGAAKKGSKRGLAALSGLSASTLETPGKYRELLQWLYRQPWYTDSGPADEDLKRIRDFRAALVDAFVYDWE